MASRIVVKVGTSTLTHPGGGMNFKNMDRLARVLSDVRNAGNEVVLVSSGAIGCGCGKLHMATRPTELSLKQAAAAVGQCELMHLYDKFFGEYGIVTGQILLSREDVDRPEVKQNLVNTIDALLTLGVIPVVNENDSVSCAEISPTHTTFGENDTLSAVVAGMCGADLWCCSPTSTDCTTPTPTRTRTRSSSLRSGADGRHSGPGRRRRHGLWHRRHGDQAGGRQNRHGAGL